MNDVARNLKRLRTQRGIRQEVLAVQLHTTRQTISNWERGQANPSIDDLMELARFFQVGVDELIYPEQEDSIHFLGANPTGLMFGLGIGLILFRVCWGMFMEWRGISGYEAAFYVVAVLGLLMVGCTRWLQQELRRR